MKIEQWTLAIPQNVAEALRKEAKVETLRRRKKITAEQLAAETLILRTLK